MKRLFAITCIVFFMVSCQTKVLRELDNIESTLHSNPELSLSRLQEMDLRCLRTAEEKAFYSLLMSAALDKNYIDIQSDSLAQIATDYYSKKGSLEHRMMAWYYMGIVLKNAQKYPSSTVAFEKSELLAEETGNNLYQGLIYRNLATLYSLSNNNSEAIEARKKAIACFDEAGLERYKIYAELSLVTDYTNNQSFNQADSLIQCIRNNSRDSVVLSYCNLRQAGILIEKNMDPHSADSLFERVPRVYYGLLDYGYRALSYERMSNWDSADYWLSEGYSTCRDQADTATLDYMKSKIEMGRSHFEKAYHLVDHAASVQDSLTRILLQQSVSAAQRDYYKSETLLREEKLRSERQKNVFGAIFSLLAIIGLLMAATIRSRKKDQQLQEKMARLALEEKELERVQRDNAHLVGSLFSEKIKNLDRLSESYFKMEEGKQKDLVFKQIKQLVSAIRNDDGLFMSLEKDLDRYCDGIMSKLRTQVPSIKGENLKAITLFFAGFSYETAQLILNKVSVGSLKMVRSRCRREITAAKAPDADLFLKMLEIEKRPQVGTNEKFGDC